MNQWQSIAKTEVGGLLRRFGVSADFESVEVREDPALGHRAGDVYLTTRFQSRQDQYEIYLYNDEAGVSINGSWHPFELPDWRHHPLVLLEGFLEFLRSRLEAKGAEAR